MKNKLKKALGTVFAIAATAALAVIPAAAEDSSVAVGLSYNPVNTSEIINQLKNWICGVILVVGVLYGGWELAVSFFDDQPSKRKQGIMILIIGITVPALIWLILSMINV